VTTKMASLLTSPMQHPPDTSAVATAGGWRVVSDPTMGKCVEATATFHVGQVVFKETPLVSASWHDYRCTCCSQLHAVDQCPVAPQFFSKKTIASLTDIEEELSNLFAIQELDKARTFLMAVLKASRSKSVLARLLSMTTANLDMCRATVDIISQSKSMSVILPSSTLVSLEQCAIILSVLNTNAHMLEEGGSALFPEAGAMFEHSCNPNCVFNTFNKELWVVVTRPIAPGERMSIDYINGFYEPKDVRREALKEVYAFDCGCQLCTNGIDKARAFHCPQCHVGPVCPRTTTTVSTTGATQEDDTFGCLQCGAVMNASQVNVCLQVEEAFGNSNPPTTAAEIDALLQQGVFHVTHHLVWVSMLHMGERMAGNPMRCRDGTAMQMWLRVLASAKYVLPDLHPELVVLEDKLGQILVCAGDIAQASSTFKRAYDMSCVLTGNVASNGNVLLKKLWEDTPQDVNQLKFFYNDGGQQQIEDLKVEGKMDEAAALEAQRDRAVSNTAMDVDEEDDL
jgi:hypothetical protein